jgi:hypothetical protein
MWECIVILKKGKRFRGFGRFTCFLPLNVLSDFCDAVCVCVRACVRVRARLASAWMVGRIIFIFGTRYPAPGEQEHFSFPNLGLLQMGDFLENVSNDLHKISVFYGNCTIILPVTVAARSKVWNVFARSNAGIVDSKPTRGMDVCVYSVFVLGSGLATGYSLVQGVLPNVLE